MRQIIHCRAIRSVCYALIIALVSTIAPTPFVRPAGAQLMPTYSVGVVDFMNESGVQGELLSRLATDAVVVEMSKTNRYDVSITRSMIKSEMEKLDLHPPLTKLGLVRLGESLQADAMLEGSIKSVQLSGSGVTRRASVTLVVQMIDQASGEIINGAVQTGTSSARVGYTPDDDSLITEAINNAAFLVVKTMVDYIVPEATVMMNIGSDQVMLNKGARDGLKPGMKMIVLRQKEIIGYIELRDVSPSDAKAKITKSMRGIQSEDKVRAIYDMPTISGSAKSEPLPSGAPTGGKGSKSSLSKIGKFLVAGLLVVGLASLFSSGRGNEDPGSIDAATDRGIPLIRWDPTQFDHGKHVVELHVLRDDFGDQPVKVLSSPTEWDRGWTKLTGLFGTGADVNVIYQRLASNPDTTTVETTVAVPVEPFGTTHTYQIRVLYREQTTSSGTGDGSTSTTTKYYYTSLSNSITATAIEPVKTTDIIVPAYDPNAAAPELLVSDLQQGKVNLQWQRKAGGDVYRVIVEPIVPGTGRTWQSPSLIYETGPTVSLPIDQRNSLANWLMTTSSGGATMRWRVDCRHQGDTNQDWIQGDWSRFTIGDMPPGTPQ